MSHVAVQRHRWSREEYDRMIAAGVFHPESRLELIDGEIVNMTPQGSLHATAVQLAQELLRSVFTPTHTIRVQMPVALGDNSEPEPDIAVVTGSPRDYRDTHPRTAVLLVEVADASLVFDREQKKALYARNAIPEYWIVNLIDRQLEVYRDPRGSDYAAQTTLRPPESITPLAAPRRSTVFIADLLP